MPDCPSEMGWGLALDLKATPGASGGGIRGSLDPTGRTRTQRGLGRPGAAQLRAELGYVPVSALHAPRGLGQNILEMYALRPPTLKPVQAGREAPGRYHLTPGPHPGLPSTQLTDGERERLSQKQGQTCDESCHAHSLNIPWGGGASTLQGRSVLTLWWGDTEAQ